MTHTNYYPDWRKKVVFAAEGPQPQVLLENSKVKIIMAGLEPGQKIPEHAEAMALYHFLDGEGWMMVDGERLEVGAGATIVMLEGAVRGIEAATRLVFLATRIS